MKTKQNQNTTNHNIVTYESRDFGVEYLDLLL